MARARNIKPGLYKNEDLAACSMTARYLFPGLWMLADREGRMEDRPKRIQCELLPYDNIDVDPLLDELANFNFIQRYEVDGQRFIQISKFVDHQTPHVREAPSIIPSPEPKKSTIKAVPSTGPAQGEASPRSPDCGLPLTSSLNPESLSTDSGPTAYIGAFSEDFEKAWDSYPKRPGASKKDSFKAWKARLKAGGKPAEMIAGVERYAAYTVGVHTDPQFIKQPASFFGPGDHFKSDWTIPQQTHGPPNGYESARDKSDRELIEGLTGKSRDAKRTIDV
jgi:hypothetical protein